MSVSEYNIPFNTPARYALEVVAEISDRFMASLGHHLINECTTSSLNLIMETDHIQAYGQNIKDPKRLQHVTQEND